MHYWSKIGCAAAVAALLLPSAGHAAVFDFESNAVNTPTPFTDTVGGLSATFTGAASVCNSPELFATLTGNFLIQGFCGPTTESGPLGIAFSSDLRSVSFNFATAPGTGTLTVQGFEDATLVGTATFASTFPSGRFNGEGFASLTGVFNRLVLTSDRLLGLDNVDAMPVVVPEPAGMAVLGAGFACLALLRRRRGRG